MDFKHILNNVENHMSIKNLDNILRWKLQNDIEKTKLVSRLKELEKENSDIDLYINSLKANLFLIKSTNEEIVYYK